MNDSSQREIQVAIEHGYELLPCQLVASRAPVQPFVPAKQHLVPKAGKTTAVPREAVLRIVTVQLLAELPGLLGNGLMPVLPTPKPHGP